jgi:hypothetical protein
MAIGSSASDFTFEIPKLEPALFGFTKHGKPTFLTISAVLIASPLFR